MLEIKIKIPSSAKGMAKAMLGQKQAQVERGVKRGAQWLVGALREQSLNGALHGRTGTLARSWAAGTAVSSGLGVRLAVGSKLAYAAIHEDGGEILPVKAKALTIPISENMTARGVPRYSTVAALKQAMGEKNVFTLKRGGKPPLIMAKTGKSDRSIHPFFVLSASVKIPARHYVSIALEAASPLVTKEIKDALNESSK